MTATQRLPTTSVFLRVNNRLAVQTRYSLHKAGYPYAVPNVGNWRETHDWCALVFRFPNGVRTYTWTGEVFWFLTKADRDTFVARYGNAPLAEDAFVRQPRRRR